MCIMYVPAKRNYVVWIIGRDNFIERTLLIAWDSAGRRKFRR